MGPPGGRNSFNFMQFLGKIWRNRMLAPPWGVGAPSSGNPGSATAVVSFFIFDALIIAQISQSDGFLVYTGKKTRANRTN